MKWVTRRRAKVDRIACPWLIKRFVDPQAEFIFVESERVMDVARGQGAIPFDVPGAELGHHGEKCSFDAILEKYSLTDPALLELGKIVRGADTQANDLTPYSHGLETVAEGFRQISTDDYENMMKQFPVYDALYAYCKMKVDQTIGP